MKMKEDFCLTCLAVGAAVLGGGSAVGGASSSSTDDEDKKQTNWWLWLGISVFVISMIILIIIKLRGGCKSCKV